MTATSLRGAPVTTGVGCIRLGVTEGFTPESRGNGTERVATADGAAGAAAPPVAEALVVEGAIGGIRLATPVSRCLRL